MSLLGVFLVFCSISHSDIPILLLDYSKIHSLKCQGNLRTGQGSSSVEVTMMIIILTKIEMDVIKGWLEQQKTLNSAFK